MKRYAVLFGIASVMSLLASVSAMAQQQKLEAIFPAEEHKQLNRLVGKWDVVVKAQFEPGKIQEEKAVLETKWVLDGRFLQQSYKSEFPSEAAGGQERPLEILQYIGFDRHKNEFFEIHLNSMDTALVVNKKRSATNPATLRNGNGLSLASVTFSPFTQKTGTLQSVITFQDEDHYTLEWFFSTPGSRRREKFVTLIHTRRK